MDLDGEGEAMHTDETWGDLTDLDDDVIPGCYMFDIGIKGFPYPKIWICADYIRVFDYLQVYYNLPRLRNIAPAVVITGQPGIGESIDHGLHINYYYNIILFA